MPIPNLSAISSIVFDQILLPINHPCLPIFDISLLNYYFIVILSLLKEPFGCKFINMELKSGYKVVVW